MTTPAASVSALQRNFPTFLLTFDESPKPVDEAQKKAVELFSETLRSCSHDKIQKRWSKIERALNQPSPIVDPKFFARVLKLHKNIFGTAALVEELIDAPDGSAPKVMEQLKILIRRIRAGVYGEDWQRRLYSSPLFVTTLFSLKRMLYIDMHLRALEPCEHAEWFSRCNKKEDEAIRNSLLDLRAKYRGEGLAEVKIRSLLLGLDSDLSIEMQARFVNFLESADGSDRYLQAVQQLIYPLDNVLHDCALEVVKDDPERAFQILLRMKNGSELLQLIAQHHEELAFNMLHRLRRIDPKRFLETLRYFVMVTKYPATIPIVLTHVYDQKMRLELFEEYLFKQYSPETVIQVLSILERYKDKDDYQLLLSSLVFVTLVRSEDPNVAAKITDFTDPELKVHLCHRLIRRFSDRNEPEVAARALNRCEPYFTAAVEKLVLLQAKVRLTAKYNPQKALELAKTAPDEQTQIALVRLCNPPRPDRFRESFSSPAHEQAIMQILRDIRGFTGTIAFQEDRIIPLPNRSVQDTAYEDNLYRPPYRR